VAVAASVASRPPDAEHSSDAKLDKLHAERPTAAPADLHLTIAQSSSPPDSMQASTATAVIAYQRNLEPRLGTTWRAFPPPGRDLLLGLVLPREATFSPASASVSPVVTTPSTTRAGPKGPPVPALHVELHRRGRRSYRPDRVDSAQASPADQTPWPRRFTPSRARPLGRAC
jgi:hypothetical protein